MKTLNQDQLRASDAFGRYQRNVSNDPVIRKLCSQTSAPVITGSAGYKMPVLQTNAQTLQALRSLKL